MIWDFIIILMVKYSYLLFKFRFMLLTIGNNLDKRCFTYVAWYFSVVVWFWFFSSKLINVSKISFQIPFSSIFFIHATFYCLKARHYVLLDKYHGIRNTPVPIVLTIVNCFHINYLNFICIWICNESIQLLGCIIMLTGLGMVQCPLKNWTLTMNRNFFISF
jgi:hypothetical protein